MKMSQSQVDALGGCAPCRHEPPEPSDTPAGGGASVLVVDPAKKAWIVIELADSTGQPRAGEAFSLTPPGGDPVDGTLDAAGKVRIEGLDPGTCRISFPDLGYEGESATTTSPPSADP